MGMYEGLHLYQSNKFWSKSDYLHSNKKMKIILFLLVTFLHFLSLLPILLQLFCHKFNIFIADNSNKLFYFTALCKFGLKFAQINSMIWSHTLVTMLTFRITKSLKLFRKFFKCFCHPGKNSAKYDYFLK